jgi:hypothetical protein
MATKKPVPTAKPAAKQSGTRALTLWEQKMADAADKSAKQEKNVSGLRGISTKGGILTVDEQAVPGNELDVVVLVAVHENQYHDKPYDPNVAQIPACYAFSDPDSEDPEGEMAPHEESEDKQGDDNGLCANCWANAMGSASQGRGKACKNVRRLALITADALESADDVKDTEVRVLKVPVTSVKGWALYVKNTLRDEMRRPYWGVVTTIKVVPDPKSQFKITFAFKELVDFDDALYDAVEKKIAGIKPQLTAPYVRMEEAPAPAPRGRPNGRAAAPAPAPRGKPLVPVGRAAKAMEAAVGKSGSVKKAKY